MRFLLGTLSLAAAFCAPAQAMPDCQPRDVAELCEIAKESLADNPEFGRTETWTLDAEKARRVRHVRRRERAVAILSTIEAPTWRDLFNAGYTIFLYGDAPEERLFAHAIAIRALSLAPDEPEVRHFVAMTFDSIGRNYVGAQLYGRQKFVKLNPTTGAVELACLPQMIDPPLPASVGVAFEPLPEGFERCTKGVGEVARARPIPQSSQ
jgi:hypothetical protein